MKRATFIFSLIFFTAICLAQTNLDIVKKAESHPIVMDKPAVGFFEGAVLGNGGMGVVVTTRPDAICFHFGHNNVWDIRIAENNKEKIGTFDEVMKKAKAVDPNLPSIWNDADFNAYLRLTAENYGKPYPRPFPCGTVLLGFDRRAVELLGHKIDISTGLCEIYLLNNGVKNILKVFVQSDVDALWMQLIDEKNNAVPSCFNRFRIIPDSHTPNDFPAYTIVSGNDGKSIGFKQVLPYLEPGKYDKEKGHPKDKAFKLEAKLQTTLTGGDHYTTQGISESLQPLERYIKEDKSPLLGVVYLSEGLNSNLEKQGEATATPNLQNYQKAFGKTAKSWSDYWNKSGVEIADDFLESTWYWNLYFYNCSVKSGVTCPGLFANWSLGGIGTAWHGDYHLNYNTQQPFWLPFSSNRLDKNLPYVELVHHLLPVSKKWAKEYYGMRGAFFPHSAYPVDMNLHPYPVPDWGWEVFETPWMVQGLWWHYKYSMDTSFLRDQAYEPIKDAVMFLVDYMKRPDAHGQQWKDDKYHIFPSVPPELYGLQPGFKYNYDTQIDLALTKFIFKAFKEAVNDLNLIESEKELIKDVNLILANMPGYPKTISEKYGEIYTSVPGENDRIVYNVPANLTHVFPGEEFGLHSPKDEYQKLVNTYKAHKNEGGNDIVFLNLQAARLGLLDLEKFKRQIQYAMLPNKTVTDKVLQAGGRYSDQTDFAFMAPMGIWFENFALPVVINECLIQSYTGTIDLFPNWDRKKDVKFNKLRAMGAFLVNAEMKNGKVKTVEIYSEKGVTCKVKNIWGKSKVQLVRNGKPAEILTAGILEFRTLIGERVVLKPLQVQ